MGFKVEGLFLGVQDFKGVAGGGGGGRGRTEVRIHGKSGTGALIPTTITLHSEMVFHILQIHRNSCQMTTLPGPQTLETRCSRAASRDCRRTLGLFAL